MLERDIRKALKERVEAYGGEVRAVSWLGRAHAPDVLCMFPAGCGGSWACNQGHGVSVFVEAKAPGGKPRPGQLREHLRMTAAGCKVLVISTLEQLDAWLPPITSTTSARG